jgi:hypothetical protein
MAQTKADAAIAAANQLIGIMAQLKGLRATLTDFVKAYNSEGYGTTWGNLATAAQNGDGTLGAADGTPTAGHPIDTRVATQAALQKAVTGTMLTNGVTLLQQLQNFFGNAVVTQANYSQTVDDLAS